MEAILLKIVDQLNGSVAILALIFIAFIWLVYKAGRLSESFDSFKGKSSQLDKNIGKINSTLSKIQATTELLYQAHLSTVKSHSPLTLTEKGIEVAKQISVEEKIKVHWEDILNEFNLKGNPANPYDIQKLSMELAESCFDEIFTPDEREHIKTYAFSAGMDMLEVYPVIGIKIRDKIFEDKGLSVKDLVKKTQGKKD